MNYYKKTMQMTGKLSSRSVTFYYAVDKKNTVQVKHVKQTDEPSEYEVCTYKTKSEKLLSDATEIHEVDFVKAIDRALAQINKRIA